MKLALLIAAMMSPSLIAQPAWEFNIREPGYKAVQEKKNSISIWIFPTDPSFEFHINPIRITRSKWQTNDEFRQQAINLVERLDFSLDYLGH